MAAPGKTPGEKQLMITGQGHRNEDELFAWYRTTTGDSVKKATNWHAGAVNVVSYEKRTIHLELVSVNGAPLPNADYIRQHLDTIYKPAIVNWVVTTCSKPVNIQLGTDNIFNNEDPDENMNYTESEKLVIAAFKEQTEATKNKLYFFLIPGETNNPDLKGYMPFNRKYGFVFTANHKNVDELIRTIAHEPGHGAFRLRHTFSPKISYIQPIYSTDNLMDYANLDYLKKTRLVKYQWDECHDWDLGLNWGEEEDEGESILAPILIKEIVDKIRQGNKEKKDEVAIQITTGYEECKNLGKLKLGKKEYEFIRMITNGFNPLTEKEPTKLIETSSRQFLIPIGRPYYKICPSEISKSYYTAEGVKFVKYEFHELQTKQNDAPYADVREPTGIVRIEFSVKDADQTAFENYLLGRDLPVPGDPLINMRIVHNNSAPNSGGMFGCARVGSGCDLSSIPSLPKYDDNKKVHDGLDLFAQLNTDVFAMYDGEIISIENSVPQGEQGTSGDLGNRVLVKHTSAEHGKNNNTIFVMYGHLNSINIEIFIGKKIRQGQLLGTSGKTGNAFNIETWRYHVHLMIYENGTGSGNKTDPRKYLTTKFDDNGNKID